MTTISDISFVSNVTFKYLSTFLTDSFLIGFITFRANLALPQHHWRIKKERKIDQSIFVIISCRFPLFPILALFSSKKCSNLRQFAAQALKNKQTKNYPEIKSFNFFQKIPP